MNTFSSSYISVLFALLHFFSESASTKCYWCTGIGEDSSCELNPHDVTSGTSQVDCSTKYFVTTKVIKAGSGRVISLTRHCDTISYGNLCVDDGNWVTCYHTCSRDLCNYGSPDPRYLPVISLTRPRPRPSITGTNHLGVGAIQGRFAASWKDASRLQSVGDFLGGTGAEHRVSKSMSIGDHLGRAGAEYRAPNSPRQRSTGDLMDRTGVEHRAPNAPRQGSIGDHVGRTGTEHIASNSVRVRNNIERRPKFYLVLLAIIQSGLLPGKLNLPGVQRYKFKSLSGEDYSQSLSGGKEYNMRKYNDVFGNEKISKGTVIPVITLLIGMNIKNRAVRNKPNSFAAKVKERENLKLTVSNIQKRTNKTVTEPPIVNGSLRNKALLNLDRMRETKNTGFGYSNYFKVLSRIMNENKSDKNSRRLKELVQSTKDRRKRLEGRHVPESDSQILTIGGMEPKSTTRMRNFLETSSDAKESVQVSGKSADLARNGNRNKDEDKNLNTRKGKSGPNEMIGIDYLKRGTRRKVVHNSGLKSIQKIGQPEAQNQLNLSRNKAKSLNSFQIPSSSNLIGLLSGGRSVHHNKSLLQNKEIIETNGEATAKQGNSRTERPSPSIHSDNLTKEFTDGKERESTPLIISQNVPSNPSSDTSSTNLLRNESLNSILKVVGGASNKNILYSLSEKHPYHQISSSASVEHSSKRQTNIAKVLKFPKPAKFLLSDANLSVNESYRNSPSEIQTLHTAKLLNTRANRIRSENFSKIQENKLEKIGNQISDTPLNRTELYNAKAILSSAKKRFKGRSEISVDFSDKKGYRIEGKYLSYRYSSPSQISFTDALTNKEIKQKDNDSKDSKEHPIMGFHKDDLGKEPYELNGEKNKLSTIKLLKPPDPKFKSKIESSGLNNFDKTRQISPNDVGMCSCPPPKISNNSTKYFYRDTNVTHFVSPKSVINHIKNRSEDHDETFQDMFPLKKNRFEPLGLDTSKRPFIRGKTLRNTNDDPRNEHGKWLQSVLIEPNPITNVNDKTERKGFDFNSNLSNSPASFKIYDKLIRTYWNDRYGDNATLNVPTNENTNNNVLQVKGMDDTLAFSQKTPNIFTYSLLNSGTPRYIPNTSFAHKHRAKIPFNKIVQKEPPHIKRKTLKQRQNILFKRTPKLISKIKDDRKFDFSDYDDDDNDDGLIEKGSPGYIMSNKINQFNYKSPSAMSNDTIGNDQSHVENEEEPKQVNPSNHFTPTQNSSVKFFPSTDLHTNLTNVQTNLPIDNRSQEKANNVISFTDFHNKNVTGQNQAKRLSEEIRPRSRSKTKGLSKTRKKLIFHAPRIYISESAKLERNSEGSENNLKKTMDITSTSRPFLHMTSRIIQKPMQQQENIATRSINNNFTERVKVSGRKILRLRRNKWLVRRSKWFAPNVTNVAGSNRIYHERRQSSLCLMIIQLQFVVTLIVHIDGVD